MMKRQRNQKTRQRVKQALSRGKDHLGTIVMWSIEGVEVERAELESLYGQYGLGADYLPPEIKPVAAFRKAIKKASSGSPDHLFRSISKSGNEIIIGIVREDVDRHHKDLGYDVECKVTLHAKDPDNAYVDVTPRTHNQGRVVAAEFRTLRNSYTSRDIYSMLRINVTEKMFGIPLRDTGGVYFVSPEFSSDLKKHKDVIRELGTSELILLQVNNDPGSREDMSKQAKKSLEAELQDIAEELETFKAEKKDVSGSMVELRLDRFKEIQEKADMYAGILDLKSTEIKQSLRDAKSILQKLFEDTEQRYEEQAIEELENKKRSARRVAKRIRKTV
jgi:hypothetical protein